MKPPVIFWYRRDLRTSDLPALSAAVATGQPLLCVYIHDECAAGDQNTGAASLWWLHHSLLSLNRSLRRLGGELVIRAGNASRELHRLVAETGATAIYCSELYEPWAREQEDGLARKLLSRGIAFHPQPGSLLYSPQTLRNRSGQPFRVFTPFWKTARNSAEPPLPIATPGSIVWHPSPVGISVEDLQLLPTGPDWAAHWNTLWQPGSAGAKRQLRLFMENLLSGYHEGRDFPARQQTSRLSPHLHFGEISPRQIYHAIMNQCAHDASLLSQGEKFLSELGWREFNHHLLYHFPDTVNQPFKSEFHQFPWLGASDALTAWQKGLTGYPIVDAGMRELWHTGYMHNRVRMICASFLTKHLLLPWQLGERWFRDTLVDADLANNVAGWQWVAGCGADAAPYFRIFNPTLQGKKFDAQGDYVRRWVPELAGVPSIYIHDPLSAPVQVLKSTGVVVGTDYPRPIVDHRLARESALAAYASLKR